MKINKTLFCLGLSIALGAAALLFFGVIESGVAAAIGIVGIGLIAASGRGKPGQERKADMKLAFLAVGLNGRGKFSFEKLIRSREQQACSQKQ